MHTCIGAQQGALLRDQESALADAAALRAEVTKLRTALGTARAEGTRLANRCTKLQATVEALQSTANVESSERQRVANQVPTHGSQQ